MIKIFKIIILSFSSFLLMSSSCDVGSEGCIDPIACNYNSTATVDDGSCWFASEDCDCRKPKSGMFLQAKKDFLHIDFSRSILIGDSDTDIQAAESIGIKSIKVSIEYTLSDWTKELLPD